MLSAQVLVRCVVLQVSCLGVEPSVDGEDTRFVLTSRNPDGSVVRYQLQGSSAEICRAWVNDVVQILESQRNFLNGMISLCFNDSYLFLKSNKLLIYSSIPEHVMRLCR